MRHFTKYAFTLLFISALVLPQFAFAAEAKFFGPLIPDECHCENQVDPNGGTLTTAPGWGCVLQVVQNGINLAISFGVIIATLFFVYAGFVWMTSGGNPGKIEQGRTMILNVIIGLVVLLSAWLIVDFIMKTLYNDSGEFGPWNAILSGGSACLVARNPTPLTDGVVDIVTSSGGVTSTDGGTGTATGYSGTSFTYQSGISVQKKDVSGPLAQVLSCMAPKLPAGVGEISSISDSKISSGAKTFAQCAAGGCAHSANSCHYGGRTCIGASYAVDFGDQQNNAVLTQAAKACGAKTNFEGDHLHVSIGAASGCGCNL